MGIISFNRFAWKIDNIFHLFISANFHNPMNHCFTWFLSFFAHKITYPEKRLIALSILLKFALANIIEMNERFINLIWSKLSFVFIIHCYKYSIQLVYNVKCDLRKILYFNHIKKKYSFISHTDNVSCQNIQ